MTSEGKNYPNRTLLSLSIILIVVGIGSAIIYPRVFLEKWDTRGSRAKAIYWTGMCVLGIILHILGLMVRKNSENGSGIGMVVIGGVASLLGAIFSIYSAPYIVKSMSE